MKDIVHPEEKMDAGGEYLASIRRAAAPYPKPSSFSDPSHDFTKPHEQAMLREVLDTPEKDLGQHDFMLIFQTIMPAGNFGECMHYFPLALAYLAQPAWDIDTLHCLNYWTHANRRELETLGIGDAYFGFLRSLFSRWMSNEMYRDEEEFVEFRNKASMVAQLIDDVCDGYIDWSMIVHLFQLINGLNGNARTMWMLKVVDHTNFLLDRRKKEAVHLQLLHTLKQQIDLDGFDERKEQLMNDLVDQGNIDIAIYFERIYMYH